MPATARLPRNRALLSTRWEDSVDEVSMALASDFASKQRAAQFRWGNCISESKALDFKRKAEDASLDLYSISEWNEPATTVVIKREVSPEHSPVTQKPSRYRVRGRADSCTARSARRGKSTERGCEQAMNIRRIHGNPTRSRSPGKTRRISRAEKKWRNAQRKRSTTPELRRNPHRAARVSHTTKPLDNEESPRERIVREVYADTSLSSERQSAIIALLEEKNEELPDVQDALAMVHPSRQVLLVDEIRKSQTVSAIAVKEVAPTPVVRAILDSCEKTDQFRTSFSTSTRSLVSIEMAESFRLLELKRLERLPKQSRRSSRTKRASPPCIPARGNELCLAIMEHTRARVEQVVRQVFSYTQYMKAKIHKSARLAEQDKQDHVRIRRQPRLAGRSRTKPSAGMQDLTAYNDLKHVTGGGARDPDVLPGVSFNMVELLRRMEGLLCAPV